MKTMMIQKFDFDKLKTHNLKFLSDSEIDCLDQIRLLDLQTQLVQEFENVTLRSQNKSKKDDRFSKENLQIKKLIPQLIEKDIQIVKEVMSTNLEEEPKNSRGHHADSR